MPALSPADRNYLESHYYAVQSDDGNDRLILCGRFDLTQYGAVVIVAVINLQTGDWAAYIGAAPPPACEAEAMRIVAKTGNKISEHDAEHYFPDLWGQELHFRR